MLIDAMVRDLRLAVRQLRRSPLYTVAAVATLAIGIGANTAMFTVVESVLWRPPAYREPDRLVAFKERLSPGDFYDLQRDARSFSALGAFSNVSVTLVGEGQPERVAGASVSSNWFQLLGRSPILGRGFAPGDEQGSHATVVVLGNGLWRRRFGGDPAVIGRSIRINGEPLAVVGVMPADLELVSDEDLWMPLSLPPAERRSRDDSYLRVYARLRTGVAVAGAQSELDALSARLARLYPATNAGLSFHAVPLQQALAGSVRSPMLLLLGAVGFLMLLVCGNLTHLELARAAAHQQEAAIRLALGAGPGQLLRERLTGALLLSLLGGGCGVLLAAWGTRVLATLAASLDNIPRLGETRVDGRVLLFALLLSLGTGLAFGLLPALQAARANLQELLKEALARASAGRRSRYLRSVLLVSELALALLLLVGAGLLQQSFRHLLAAEPGFHPERCAAMRVVLPREATAGAEVAFARRVLDTIRALPGVASAALVTNLPLTSSQVVTPVWIENLPIPPAGQEPQVDLDSVSSSYFETMGTPLVRGRSILPTDRAGTPAVAVVSRAMAERFWPHADPVGKRLSLESGHGPWVTVAGVAQDVKRHGLDQAVAPQIYQAFDQQPAFYVTFVVRTVGNPLTVVGDLRRSVWATDPTQAVAWVRPLTEVVSMSIGKPRFMTTLLTLFAAIALVLAAVGMYGVMAHSVSQRHREIAVRLALGARRSEVMRLVLGNAAALTLAGLGLGLAGALALGHLLTRFVFGVSTTDPLTLATISLLVGGTAMISTYVPARRAARTAPGNALRLG